MCTVNCNDTNSCTVHLCVDTCVSSHVYIYTYVCVDTYTLHLCVNTHVVVTCLQL